MNTNSAIAADDPKGVPQVELTNARFLGEGRVGLVLIASLLLVLSRAPAHAWLVAILAFYAVYSVVQLQRVTKGAGEYLARFGHWVDAGCYCAVIGLASGLAGALSIFLLFPVFVASLQRGLRSGIAVAFLCILWLVALSVLHPLQLSHPFDEFSVASATFLLLVAFVIARWGQSEVTVMRRFALASDLSRVFSPHRGLDYSIYALGETLRTYQRADMCILVVNDAKSSGWLLYEVRSGNGETPTRARRIGVELAQSLLCVPPDQAVVYRRRGFFSRRTMCSAYDWPSLCARPTDETALTSLADLLETNCFVSLPLRSRCETIGRVYLASQRTTYMRRDVRFLTDIMGQAAVMIENMQLVDRLAQERATEERKRISRDLHDGTIQPYIGLKLGLEALRRKCAPDDVLGHEVDDLLKMAGDSIVELTSYVGRLKKTPERPQQVSLFPAVRQQAEKFSEFYGIDAHVVAAGDVLVKSRLFDEIMHIVREGMSNVRRHTCASRILITLRTSNGQLLLEFVNDKSTRGDDPQEFCPRSISERATELGGRVSVEERPGGCTAVAVDIPL